MFVVFVIWVIGLFVTLSLSNGLATSRWGSVGVAFGVMYFAVLKLEFDKNFRTFMATIGISPNVQYWLYLVPELTLVPGATLIWGYGDLIHSWF